MKHLKEYIFENIVNIFESGGFNTFFDNVDDCIDFYNDHKDIFKKYGINDTIIKQLYNLLNGEIPLTIDVDNKTLKLRRLFQDNPDILNNLGEFSKAKDKFQFKNSSLKIPVGDGGLSSRSKSGKNTEPQELLFCDMINSGGNIDFNEALQKYKLDSSFKLSAEIQFEKFKKYVGESYNDYEAYRPSNSKDTLNIKFNEIIKNKKVFHGARTQYITPADVFVYKKSEKQNIENLFDNLLNKFNESDSKIDYNVVFTDCKNHFVEMLHNKVFIPISLKKITKSNKDNKLEELNINAYTIDLNENEYSLRLTDNGFVGEFYTNNNEYLKFNFRSNQKTIYPLTFEFNKKGDGGAVGKFKTFVESYIELSPIDVELPTVDEFYKQYKENSKFDLKKFYKEKISIANKLDKFIDPKYNNTKLEEIQNDDKLFYILVVCLLFVEFLYKLYNSSKNMENNEFFNFIKDSYMASKKITKYSLPYLLIK